MINPMTKRAMRKGMAWLAMSCAASGAMATENGPTTPFGVYDFGAGMMPPPSENGTVGLRISYYTPTRSTDGEGNTVPNNIKLSVLSIGAAYIRMTDTQWWGANVGFGAAMPFLRMKGSVDVKTPAGPLHLDSSAFTQGDIQLYPLILQWNLPPRLFANAALQVQAPTGDYDAKRLFNPGNNHWAVGPLVGMTYLSPSGFEASTKLELSFNTINPATRYRNGVEFKQEFALGQHVGPYTVGLGGYWYKQLTDDSAPGLTSGKRAQVAALGPAISFFQPGLPALWFHIYKEFEARNRSEGYAAALRLAKSF